MSGHSRALQMTCELGTSRSALTVKCPPKQPIACELLYVCEEGVINGNVLHCSRLCLYPEVVFL